MTAYPAPGYISDPTRKEGEGKQYWEDMLQIAKETPGGAAEAELTINAGVITPTGALHQVDTEADAPTDTLTHAAVTNHPDGRLISLRAVAVGRVVTVQHGAGGDGQFLLAAGASRVLSTTSWVTFRRVGNSWIEDDPFFGAIQVDPATLNVGMGAAPGSGAHKLNIGGVTNAYASIGDGTVSAYMQGYSSGGYARFGALSAHGVQIVVGGGATTAITAAVNGYVGIGDPPTFDFHVNKDQATATMMVCQNQDASASARAQFRCDTNAGGIVADIQSVAAGGVGSLSHTATGPFSILTTQAANLVLATASMNAVTINASQQLQFNAYGAGDLQTDASGNVTAVSDPRLKENMLPFTRGMDALKQVETYSYNYNRLSGLDRLNTYYGFSTDNLERGLPEAVGMQADGYKTLITRPILAALVNAVKELDARLAALETT